LYSTLGIEVAEEELERAVKKHSWENIPEEEKGEGKRRRKATPGGWREDLTPGQARIIERITAPLLKEFYPHEAQSLDLKEGVTRAAAPGSQEGRQEGRVAAQNTRKLNEAYRLLAEKDRELAKLRARLSRSGADTDANDINPENIVWIFGSGRSGTTWLSLMMGDIEGHTRWNEPAVGALFGGYYYNRVNKRKRESSQFIMGSHKETWLRSIRNFVLDGARAIFPTLGGNEYLVIKEPPGAIGAPLMMEALPESRMIFLVRDPRDVIASWMDANRKEGWNYERNMTMFLEGRSISPDKDRDAFVEERAKSYLKLVSRAKEAYEAHQGYKVLVKYEELRSDTLGTMKRVYSTLGIEVDEKELERAVKKHSWENIPQEKKGEGKFHRKATPGGWRKDLTPEQARIIERMTAPLLKRFYPNEVQSEGSL
jgi:hypothetical protein